MRKAGWSIGMALAAATVAQAQDETVSIGPPPEWVEPSELMPVPSDAEGLIFVRRNDALVRLTRDGQVSYIGQRIKLLHPQALQAGNIAIPWNPAAGTPAVHAVRIHRDGVVIDVLETTRFEVLRREDQLEQARLDGMLTAVLRVPDLRVDDELEVAFSVPGHDPTLGDESFGMMFLADAPPPGRYRLALSWEDGERPNIRVTPDLEPLVQRSANELVVLGENLPAIAPRPRTPPRVIPGCGLRNTAISPTGAEVSRRFDATVRCRQHACRAGLRRRGGGGPDRGCPFHAGSGTRAQAPRWTWCRNRCAMSMSGCCGGNLTPGERRGNVAAPLRRLQGQDRPAMLALLRRTGDRGRRGAGQQFGRRRRAGRSAGRARHGSIMCWCARRSMDGDMWMDGTFRPMSRPPIRANRCSTIAGSCRCSDRKARSRTAVPSRPYALARAKSRFTTSTRATGSTSPRRSP